MSVRLGSSRVCALIASVAICACAFRSAAAREQPWPGLAKRIESASNPDSTAVLVLFDQDVLDSLRSRLPRSFAIVPFRHPGVPQHDVFAPAQLGSMYRAATTATGEYPEVWVIGRRAGPTARPRAARIADTAVSLLRRRVLRDSVSTARGMVTFSRWVDRPGGAAQRAAMQRAQAFADSVIELGVPKPTPITSPFTRSELHVDPDTLSYYLAELADTSFYSIGGCSEVEITNWNAPERLGQLGPGVIPVLVERIADPDPFVRERVQEALLYATQDERVLSRTGGEYLKFYDRPDVLPRDIVRAWWASFGHYWSPTGSIR